MRTKLKPTDALKLIINRTHIPSLGDKSHSEYVERFAYTVTRDTLLLLGIEFPYAEKMAGQFDGCARTRFAKCARRLNL